MIQSPTTLIFPVGAVSIPEIFKLLKVFSLVPLIVVSSVKFIVPVFALNVPELIQLPPTDMLFDPAVRVEPEFIVMSFVATRLPEKV